MKRASTYPASEIPDNIKTNLATLYIIQQETGKSRAQFLNELSQSGFKVGSSTIDRWASRVKSGKDAISPEKLSGGSPSLDRDQRDVSSGWVLDELDHGRPVHLETFTKAVDAQHHIQISPMTASNYLREDGFSSRTLQKKSASFIVDVGLLRSDLWKWVHSNQKELNSIPKSKLGTIDFTFTGHRTDHRTGFGIKGGAQPMESAGISKYTNCIITCLWADGKNRTPPMLFTYNPAFRTDRNRTERRDALEAHLAECLKRHKINVDRVVYIGKEKGEKEVYAKECPDLLRRFFEHYGVEDDSTILSDNGNSFFEDGSSVLEDLGFKKHKCYPANVHQYISPNDNPLHGTAKQPWRTCGVDHSDDVDSCLTLLKFLDRDIIKNSQYWFNRNMLEMREEDVEKVVASAGSKKSHLHKAWLRRYRIFMGKDARGEIRNVPEEIKDTLDGEYWGLKK